MMKKTEKNIFKTLFIISLVALILSGIVNYNLYNTRSSPSDETEIMQLQLDELKNERQTLLDIVEADELLISKNNPEKALQRYESLSETSTQFEKSIAFRVKYSREVIASNKDDEAAKINLRTQLANIASEKDSLTKQLDTLRNTIATFEDLSKKNLDSLNQELEQIKKELARKDAKQVISFVNENGNLIHYLGEVKDGKANGGGIGIWNTGSIYKGEWKANQRHGEGEFKWADGQIYKGDFIDDIRSGEGTYYWPSGEKYVGEFEGNKMNGEGILYDPDGNKKFEGVWKNDKPKQ